MKEFDERQDEKAFAEAIQREVESRYPNFQLLYHGTSLSNALSIANGFQNRVPNIELARELCKSFLTSLDQVISDPDTGGFFRDFVFSDLPGRSRESEFYAATRVQLAGRYSSRGPEWKYHLLIYFACKSLGINFNVSSHIQQVENWIAEQLEQAVIVVLDASDFPNFPTEDDFMKKISDGNTVTLTYPIPETVKYLEHFEWDYRK